MNILTYPLRYLWLNDEKGRALYKRDLLVVAGIAAAMSVPFLFSDKANYFGPSGFVERIGSFSSILTGFYIAALVAVATFAAALGDLDTPIKVGKILEKGGEGVDDKELSRREYVCALFGYLAFLSMIISITALTVVVTAPVARDAILASSKYIREDLLLSISWFRGLCIVAFSASVSNLLVTTLHGLYYLVYRIYAQPAKLLPKDETSGQSEVD